MALKDSPGVAEAVLADHLNGVSATKADVEAFRLPGYVDLRTATIRRVTRLAIQRFGTSLPNTTEELHELIRNVVIGATLPAMDEAVGVVMQTEAAINRIELGEVGDQPTEDSR